MIAVPSEIDVVCRWCGGEAIRSPYGVTWTCKGCWYHIEACRCSRATQPVAPETTAIIPLHAWPGGP